MLIWPCIICWTLKSLCLNHNCQIFYFSLRIGDGPEWVHETSVSTWCFWLTFWLWLAVLWLPSCAFSRTKDRLTNFQKAKWNWLLRKSSRWHVELHSLWLSSSPWPWRSKLGTHCTSCSWSLWHRTLTGRLIRMIGTKIQVIVVLRRTCDWWHPYPELRLCACMYVLLGGNWIDSHLMGQERVELW